MVSDQQTRIREISPSHYYSMGKHISSKSWVETFMLRAEYTDLFLNRRQVLTISMSPTPVTVDHLTSLRGRALYSYIKERS